MKKNIIKKMILAVVLSLGMTSAQAYTYDEVFAACERAYDNGQQIATCVNNVCGFFGCDSGGTSPISG